MHRRCRKFPTGMELNIAGLYNLKFTFHQNGFGNQKIVQLNFIYCSLPFKIVKEHISNMNNLKYLDIDQKIPCTYT